MSRDLSPVAEPETRQRIFGGQFHIVFRAEARHPLVDRGGADVQGGQAILPPVFAELGKDLGQGRPAGDEIEAGEILVVEESAADRGLSGVDGNRVLAPEARQVSGGPGKRAAALGNRRPMADQTLQQYRLRRGEYPGRNRARFAGDAPRRRRLRHWPLPPGPARSWRFSIRPGPADCPWRRLP